MHCTVPFHSLGSKHRPERTPRLVWGRPQNKADGPTQGCSVCIAQEVRPLTAIRVATGRKSAVPQCFQPARFSFLNWLEFCLVEKRRGAAGGSRQPRSKPGSPARSRGGAGCHRCPGAPSGGGGPPRPPPVPLPPAARRQRRRPPLHQRRREAVVGTPAGAARRGCHRTGRRAPGGAFVVHGGPSTPASLLGALESRGSCWRPAGIGGGASSVLGSEATLSADRSI